MTKQEMINKIKEVAGYNSPSMTFSSDFQVEQCYQKYVHGMELVKLYHGGVMEVKPDDLYFPGPRGKFDFGSGFYLAESKHVAEEWVKDKPTPIINEYNLLFRKDDSLFLEKEDWLKVIVGHRRELYDVHFTKNIVIGEISS